MVPPSPPAETRARLRREIDRALRTYTGRLPAKEDLVRLTATLRMPWAHVMSGRILARSAAFDLTGLSAYYKFEGAAGVKGTDSSINAEDLADHNSVGDVAGKIGRGASFNGSSQYLSRADDSRLSMGNGVEFTIHGWINHQGGAGWMVVKGSPASAASLEYGMNDNAGHLQFLVSDGGSVSNDQVLTALSGWCFVTLRVWNNGGTPTVEGNVNQGVKVTSLAHVWAQDGASPFQMGARTDAFPAYLNGYLDSFGIWKRKLSDSELDALYNSGNGFDPL